MRRKDDLDMKKRIMSILLLCTIVFTTCKAYASSGSGRFYGSEQENRYSSGQYKVGTDIPIGEYILFASGGTGYFAVSSDSNGSDIIVNENFDYNTIISVSDGQYFELVRCYAVPLDETDTSELKLDGEGMFKVGTHIPAGEYKLNADITGKGYYCIYDSSTQENIISNNNFDGSQYVTVQDGQYLQLVRCSFDSVPEMVYEDADTIKIVQEKLNELGYECGTPDGIAGENTQNAIIQFKKDNGLDEDSKITKSVLDLLTNEKADVQNINASDNSFTLDMLQDAIRTEFSNCNVQISDIAESGNTSLFTVTTDNYGQNMLAVDLNDNEEIAKIAIMPTSLSDEQAENYFVSLAKYMCSIDPNLDEYTAMSIISKCNKEAVTENGISYLLDFSDSLTFLIQFED